MYKSFRFIAFSFDQQSMPKLKIFSYKTIRMCFVCIYRWIYKPWPRWLRWFIKNWCNKNKIYKIFSLPSSEAFYSGFSSWVVSQLQWLWWDWGSWRTCSWCHRKYAVTMTRLYCKKLWKPVHVTMQLQAVETSTSSFSASHILKPYFIAVYTFKQWKVGCDRLRGYVVNTIVLFMYLRRYLLNYVSLAI